MNGANPGGAIALGTNTTINTDAGQLTVTGVVGGAGDVNKMGGGTLLLNGLDTYTGTTNVNGGILQFATATGLGANASPATVANGATPQVAGAVTVVSKTSTLNGTGVGLTVSTLLEATGTSTPPPW